MTMTHFDAGTAKLIGETIRKARLGLGITKAEAARRAELSRRTWHEVEAGTRIAPTAVTLAQFDRVLGLRAGTLFGMTGRSTNERIEELRAEAINLVRRMSSDELEAFVGEGEQSLRDLLASLDKRLSELQREGSPPATPIESRRAG